jgi:hypothetical protein
VGYLAHRVKVLAGQALWVDTGANARDATAAHTELAVSAARVSLVADRLIATTGPLQLH